MSYITYHNHDTKSLLDSCLKTKDLVKWAKANKMDSVGVCNHGEMSSHIELYKECIKSEIKPLLGIEFYVTENNVDDEGKRIRDNWHLIAIVKNKVGWHNMIKLHNLSFRDERYYYDPRITLEDLKPFEEIFNNMDEKHQYEKIIYDAYVTNNDFTLTKEQRDKAYESYKQTRIEG